MRVFLLGFENSHIYQDTTATKLAIHAKFEFRKGLNKEDKYDAWDDILIRYGDKSYPSFDKYFREVLNRAEVIKRNCNKLEAFYTLRKNNIVIPQFWIHKENIQFPALRRKEYHSRGTDIIFLKDKSKKIPNGDFYVEFIESDREYKSYIFKDRCIRLSLKVPNEKEDTHQYIRSYNRGWLLSDHYPHIPKIEKELILQSIQAVKLLGLDFGVIDSVIEKETNIPYLLEVNSCPRLNRYGREIFTKEFREHLGLEIDEDIPMGLVRNWEYQSKVPMKYRRAYHNREQRNINEKGL